MYVYKNGMRYLAEDKAKNVGYHFHNDLTVKIGKNVKKTLRLHVDGAVKAGSVIPFNMTLQKIMAVRLNGSSLQPKIDYVLQANSAIAFTFGLISSDKVEIEGLT